jgi:uridine kinase
MLTTKNSSHKMDSSRYIVAVGGPSCAGKTELAKRLAHDLVGSVLLLDSYYRDLSALSPAERAAVNFDDPSALDHELLVEQLRAIRRGEIIERPIYDFATHTRVPARESFAAHQFVIVEGLFALYWPELRELATTKVFVTAPDDVCFSRRQRRDVVERGRTAESVRTQFTQTVQPMASLYVRPTSRYADLVLSGEQPLWRSAEAVLELVYRKGAPVVSSAPRNRISPDQILESQPEVRPG